MRIPHINDQREQGNIPGRAQRKKDVSMGKFFCRAMKICAVAQKGATLRLDQLKVIKVINFEVIKSKTGIAQTGVEVTDI